MGCGSEEGGRDEQHTFDCGGRLVFFSAICFWVFLLHQLATLLAAMLII